MFSRYVKSDLDISYITSRVLGMDCSNCTDVYQIVSMIFHWCIHDHINSIQVMYSGNALNYSILF